MRGPRSTGLVSAVAMAVLFGASEGAAQNLEEYDYEHLGLQAVGVEVVWANAKDAKGTVGFGVRADLGFLGPPVHSRRTPFCVLEGRYRG
jgi:hypothetical protein